ncbi:exported protein of unknown function [Candidatus Hydrogenisulfobacillus filiaventi]|uniref:PepSY domain-containing protein n=1 Tax=Candidatus Hydrogenisulfobacillus filiaventi TaxID=2707344 RepID=A0A6F8ZC39_9FIRM|nr:exported protein of unknown function [Candidatus Hydrogenisulfobacillus filiaventi]
MRKWWVVLASLGVGGGALAAIPGSAQLVAGAMSGSAGLAAAAAPAPAGVSATAAESIAVKAVGGGQAVSVVRTREQGQVVYNVQVEAQGRRFAVKVNLNGQVVAKAPETEEQGEVAVSTSTVSVPPATSLTAGASLSAGAAAAAKTALAAVGGGQVVSVRAEGDSGHWVVTVADQGQRFIVKLNAQGAILTLRTEASGEAQAPGQTQAGDSWDLQLPGAGSGAQGQAQAGVSALPPGIQATLSGQVPGLLRAHLHDHLKAEQHGHGVDVKDLLDLQAGGGE